MLVEQPLVGLIGGRAGWREVREQGDLAFLFDDRPPSHRLRHQAQLAGNPYQRPDFLADGGDVFGGGRCVALRQPNPSHPRAFGQCVQLELRRSLQLLFVFFDAPFLPLFDLGRGQDGLDFVDAGADEELIRLKVFGLNAKLADKLSEAELLSTILVTVSRAIQKRSSANQPVPVPVSANGTALPAPVPSMPAASGVSSRATSASQFAAPPQP